MRTASIGRRGTVCVVLTTFLLAACGGGDEGSDGGDDQSDAGPYRLGLVHSSEGPFATNSATMRAGANYAVDLINADGGVNGRDIELVEVDARNDPQTLVTAIPQLVTEEEIFALLAPVDSAGCEIACAIAADLQVPALSAGAGRPGVLEPSRPWSFTMTAPDASNSIPVLEAIMAQEAVQTAAIIVDEANATTQAQGDLYNEVFDASDVELVSTVTFASGDSSFASQVTSMASANPDVIALAAGPADAARIAVEIRAQGLESLLIGTGSLQAGGTDYINGAGDAAEGTLTAAQFNPDNPDEPAASLLAQAEEDNDLDAVSLNFSYAFDIVNLIATYLTDSGVTASPDTLEDDRQGLLDYLEDVEAYEGMSGDVTFAEDGTGDRPELYAVVENGAFVISEVGS
ncbi:MAG: ABC transporter substrate-binding protein [Geodermatophilaceae bacterium]|nr:ABC transporter substrate-binding protein [Geodermatophilaceae bacterium]